MNYDLRAGLRASSSRAASRMSASLTMLYRLKTAFVLGGDFPISVPVESRWIEAQLAQLKSIDHLEAQIIAASSKKKESEIEAAIQQQTILTPEQAKEWGLIQGTKDTYNGT